jgi:Carbohydrate phosphorylase
VTPGRLGRQLGQNLLNWQTGDLARAAVANFDEIAGCRARPGQRRPRPDAVNGAVTIGTLDGANIEIRDRVGTDNFFLLGLDAPGAAALRAGDYSPRAYYEQDGELRAAIDAIATGVFSSGAGSAFSSVVDPILGRDEYLTLADYRAYVDCQDTAAQAWQDPDRWAGMLILNTARSGFFSSDRTVRDYCATIWHATPSRSPSVTPWRDPPAGSGPSGVPGPPAASRLGGRRFRGRRPW